MNKQIFDEIISNIKNMENLVIRTSNIKGCGINGCDSYIFKNSKEDNYELDFIESCEGYIVIRFGYNKYMRKIYLPYNTIDWVEEREYSI